jgi:hypothetical protein
MNCRQVHENIEGYYEGELPLDEELGIDIHLVQCPKCEFELGGIKALVVDVRDSLDSLPNVSQREDLQIGMEELDRLALEHEHVRSRFFKKDLLLQLMFLVVVIPTFWLVGNKVLETYSASDTLLDSKINPPTQSGQQMQLDVSSSMRTTLGR